MTVKELAREGLNTQCTDCGDTPLFGGMRCLCCFQHAATLRRSRSAPDGSTSPSGPPHLCSRHVPSVVCYVKCKCRCDDCRDVRRDYDKSRK